MVECLIPSAPSPEESCRPIDAIRAKVRVAFDCDAVIGSKVNPGTFQTAGALRAVFRNDEHFAAMIVRYRSNAIAAAAETPLAFETHHRPRAVTHACVTPRPAEKIVPTQFQPP